MVLRSALAAGSARQCPEAQKAMNASPLNPLSASRPRGGYRPPAGRGPLRALVCPGGTMLQARMILLAAVLGQAVAIEARN
jgi:hypothetical protein